MKKLLIILFLGVTLISCARKEYTIKIYYQDGSTNVVTCISEAPGAPSLHEGDLNCGGTVICSSVKRFEISSEKTLK